MSIATEITRLQTAKSGLKTSIESKGVTVPSATTIDGYPALVDQIDNNKSEYWTAGWQFIRPAEWPDLDIFDMSSTLGLVATYDCRDRIADPTLTDGFLINVANYKNVTLERGTITNGVFTANMTTTLTKNSYYCELLPTNEGDFVVYRVTFTAGDSARVSIDPISSTSAPTAARTTDGVLYSNPKCVELKFNIPYAASIGAIIPASEYLRHVDAYDVGKNNTGNISYAFQRSYLYKIATNLEYIDSSSWDLGTCTTMANAFKFCTNLKKIKGIESWNTSSVANISSIFDRCSSITELNLSNWNTSSLTNINYAFYCCYNLKVLNLTGWNVTLTGSSNAANCFRGLRSVEELDLRGFNFSGVTSTSLQYFFESCLNLKTLKMENVDFSSATSLAYMFNQCTSLEDCPLSGMTISMATVTNIGYMFQYCTRLKKMDMRNWNPTITSANSTHSVFRYCINLEFVAIPDTITVMHAYIFYDCYNLKSIIMEATTPPTWAVSTSIAKHWNPNYKIYVPDENVNVYKTTTGWTNVADHIYSMSEYTG